MISALFRINWSWVIVIVCNSGTISIHDDRNVAASYLYKRKVLMERFGWKVRGSFRLWREMSCKCAAFIIKVPIAASSSLKKETTSYYNAVNYRFYLTLSAELMPTETWTSQSNAIHGDLERKPDLMSRTIIIMTGKETIWLGLTFGDITRGEDHKVFQSVLIPLIASRISEEHGRVLQVDHKHGQ